MGLQAVYLVGSVDATLKPLGSSKHLGSLKHLGSSKA